MNMMPLIRHESGDAPFAYRGAEVMSANQFLWDVSQLASALPDGRHVLNLCADRYHFIVGFAAALLRQHINLLPPNHTPHMIDELTVKYPDVYCLTDTSIKHPLLDTLFYPQPTQSASAEQKIPCIPSTQIAAIVFTSGSSGQPVPYQKTWSGLAKSAIAAADRFGIRADSKMCLLGTVPPQHMYGLESTALIVMQNGLAMHAGRPFYPADIYAQLAASPRPRGLVTTPVHLRALLAEYTALPSLDFLLCATAPLTPQLAAEAEAKFATPLYEIYGCTEAGQIATRRTFTQPEWHAYPGIQLWQDEQGTWVGGSHIETETLLNDIIELCSPETFLLHGRSADLINIAGKRTSLAHLNYHLNSILGVRDGVFIMPEEAGQEAARLMAFVVAPGLTSEEILSALRLRIDAAFLPRPLRFVDVLPRTATGKLPHAALTELVSQLR